MDKKTLIGIQALFLLLLQLLTGNVCSQNVTVTTPIVKDSTIVVFKGNELLGKSVYASGQVRFTAGEGYVRILLSNDTDYDILVYETMPLFVENDTDIFTDQAMESADIANGTFNKVRVEIKNAEVSNLKINVSEKTRVDKLKAEKQADDRIAQMNKNLEKQRALWRAGETLFLIINNTVSKLCLYL